MHHTIILQIIYLFVIIKFIFFDCFFTISLTFFIKNFFKIRVFNSK